MKTKMIKPLLAIVCLLSSINASAYDFEVDGVYYDVVSLSDLTCEVAGVEKNNCKGDFAIPAHVNYSNRTLTVVGIAKGAFFDCREMTGITIPNTVTSVGSEAFRNCGKLELVKIEDGETELTVYNPFWGCPIKSLYVGRNLSFPYYDSPFSNNNIEDLTIGNSVTEIGSSAFRDCRGLTSVTIGNSVTKIGNSAFFCCSGLTSVTIPNSVTEIGYEAFYRCSGLTSMTIPNSVTYIGYSAFSGCSGLTSVTIPNSVTEIGGWTFSGCSGLTSVTIPNSVTEIDYEAFSGCSGLTELYLYGITPPKAFECVFSNNQYMTLNVYVPQEALEAYQNADVWKNFWNLQGFDATGIKGIEIDGKDTKGRCYDLRGYRLSAPKRGINIINGRKVMVK